MSDDYAFRKINIEYASFLLHPSLSLPLCSLSSSSFVMFCSAYDEDVLQDSELFDPDPRSAAQALDDAKRVQQEVRQSLGR